MRDYYRHARLVDRAARYAMERSSEQPGSLLGRFHDWRSRLSNSEFSVVRDQVLLRTSNILPADLSLFMFAARHRLRLAPDTVDRLHGFVPHATWDAWKQLLALPHASYGLRAMQECGGSGGAPARVAQDRMPSRARFLSSLHRGRTHTRRHRRSGIDERRPLRRVCSTKFTIRRWSASPCCCTTSEKAPATNTSPNRCASRATVLERLAAFPRRIERPSSF